MEDVLEMLIGAAFTGLLIGGGVVYLLLSAKMCKEQETIRTANVIPRPLPVEKRIDIIARRLHEWDGVEYHISYTNILWDGKSEMTDDPDEYERSFSKKIVAD